MKELVVWMSDILACKRLHEEAGLPLPSPLRRILGISMEAATEEAPEIVEAARNRVAVEFGGVRFEPGRESNDA